MPDVGGTISRPVRLSIRRSVKAFGEPVSPSPSIVHTFNVRPRQSLSSSPLSGDAHSPPAGCVFLHDRFNGLLFHCHLEISKYSTAEYELLRLRRDASSPSEGHNCRRKRERHDESAGCRRGPWVPVPDAPRLRLSACRNRKKTAGFIQPPFSLPFSLSVIFRKRSQVSTLVH